MKKLRIGIVGLGAIATRVHIPVLKSREDVVVVAGAEIDDYQRKRSQDRFGLEEVFFSYEEMLEKSNMDAVYICLPNHLHLIAVEKAFSKGLHVYCEKPVGLSSIELSRLVGKAKDQDLIFMPGYHLRFNENYQRAKETIQSKLIGGLIQIQASFLRPGPYAGWDPKSEWYYDQENMGVLYDFGSHVVDLLNFLTREKWQNVFATYISSHKGLDTPDNIGVLMKNRELICSFNVGWNSGCYFDAISIHGTAGSVFASPDSFEHIYPSFGGMDKLQSHVRNATILLKSKVKRILKSAPSTNEFFRISDHFIKSVLGLEKPELSGEDALTVHHVLEAVKESLTTQGVSNTCQQTYLL